MDKLDPISAGDLRHRVVIEAASDTQNATGEVVQSWTTYATVWASIEPASGKQISLTQAHSLGSVETHKITMRPVKNLTTNHRIRYGTRLFSINSTLNENEMGYRLTINATEYLK